MMSTEHCSELILKLLADKKQVGGQRGDFIDALSKAKLEVPLSDLALVMAELVESGQVLRTGVKRGTRYYLSGVIPEVKEPAAPKVKKEPVLKTEPTSKSAPIPKPKEKPAQVVPSEDLESIELELFADIDVPASVTSIKEPESLQNYTDCFSWIRARIEIMNMTGKTVSKPRLSEQLRAQSSKFSDLEIVDHLLAFCKSGELVACRGETQGIMLSIPEQWAPELTSSWAAANNYPRGGLLISRFGRRR